MLSMLIEQQRQSDSNSTKVVGVVLRKGDLGRRDNDERHSRRTNRTAAGTVITVVLDMCSSNSTLNDAAAETAFWWLIAVLAAIALIVPFIFYAVMRRAGHKHVQEG